jgi:hypothetical protein
MKTRMFYAPTMAKIGGNMLGIAGGRGSEASMKIFVVFQKSNGEQGENPRVAPVAQSDRATDF